MAKKESVGDKIRRIRPPRVHITYNVETNGAPEIKELPFVVGVLADLSGHTQGPKDHRLRDIDRDDFDKVMKAIKPSLGISVENKLTKELGTELGVSLEFGSIKDFDPDNLVKKIKPLDELVQARKNLKEVLARMDSNDKLEPLLRQILDVTEAQRQPNDAPALKEESHG